MRPIKPTDIKAARYAVHLRNLAAYVNHLAAEIEDNPTDVRVAREALRQVRRRCSIQMAAHIERPLSAPDIAAFVDSWNKLAEDI